MAEFQLFQTHVEVRKCGSILEIKPLNEKQLMFAYPNITCLYELFLAFPMTMTTTKRSFSKLKLLKTASYYTMVESWLSSLLIQSIERNISNKVDYGKFINAFSINRPHHLPF